jgi:transposase
MQLSLHGKKVSRMTKDEQIEILQQRLKEELESKTELHRIIAGLNETVGGLTKTVDELNQRIKELTEQLGMNSKNSSKPPSTDINKPSPKSLRKPSGKKSGGQPGHPGSHLNITTEPDEIILHVPDICKSCPHHDACVSKACIGETRKVVDAVVQVKVTAHQSLVINCPLRGISHKGEFPEGIKATIQYGENLQSLVVAMNTVGAVSLNRTQEILSGIFGIPLSTGTIVNMVYRCADSITGTIEEIKQRVTASDITHFDESGTNVDGKNHWVHSASTSRFTHLTLSAKRGKEGMDEGGVLPRFMGKAIHDCWPAYWKYPLISFHGICNQHILRELIAAQERQPEQKWASEFEEFLLAMKATKDKAVEEGQSAFSEKQLEEYDREYEKIIKLGYDENPPPPEDENALKKRGRKKKGKTLALIERLEKHKGAVCLFAKDFTVPFTNNAAEQDIRVIKVKSKVSGCFRSELGAKNYLKIMSYVGTVKKHGNSAYEAIKQAITGNSGFFLQETY